MILSIEIFANIKGFDFQACVRTCKLPNEKKKMWKFLHSSVLFQICAI